MNMLKSIGYALLFAIVITGLYTQEIITDAKRNSSAAPYLLRSGITVDTLYV